MHDIAVICDLSWGLDTLPEAKVYYGKNEKKAQHQLPANTPDVSQPWRLVDLKNISPIEIKHMIHQLGERQDKKLLNKVTTWSYCNIITVKLFIYVVSVTHTYMHLRVKFLCRRPWGIRPGHVVHSKIVGAVRGIPDIVTVCPRQDAGERGVEVEEGPGDDSVVVERHVQSDDTYSISYTWKRESQPQKITFFHSSVIH